MPPPFIPPLPTQGPVYLLFIFLLAKLTSQHTGRVDAQRPQGSCLIPCIHHWAASPIVSTTSRKRSSKEDPNSDTSQLLNSQEFRNDYFSDHKAFSSYDISGASWWHKVTPDEHKQLHGAMLHFFMEQCFMVLHPKSACQKPRERREHNQDDLLPLPSINHRALAETGCRVQ